MPKITLNRYRSENLPFKPRARMLLLLGDQLIRDPGIAVFELAKNAYDADSPYARITMSNISDQQSGSIVIEDAGTGMDYETVTNVWLEPGTDYRGMQRGAGVRTERYKRLPQEKKALADLLPINSGIMSRSSPANRVTLR